MKIIYLLPPSEGKNSTPPDLPLVRGGADERLSFPFEKPRDIALSATEKDLKCTGKRYEEGMEMNRNLVSQGAALLGSSSTSCQLQDNRASTHSFTCPQGEGIKNTASLSLKRENSRVRSLTEDFIPAISRYSGVMYSAINYEGMSDTPQKYFDEHFLILSGMYGILRPQDTIGNYKLPIETKGLVKFWDTQITDTLNDLKADVIVDLLPLSYKKMIQWKNLEAKVLRVEFYHKTPFQSSSIQGEAIECEPSIREITPPHLRGMSPKGQGEQLLGGERKKMTHGVKKVKGEWIHELCHRGGIDILEFGKTQELNLEIEV